MKTKLAVTALSLAVLIGSVFLFSGNPIAILQEEENAIIAAVNTRAGANAVLFAAEVAAPEITLAFSETGHFFDETIYVTITASNPDAQIFYTLDGSPPTANSRRHNAPVRFNSGSRITAHTLRAVAVYGVETSRVFTHTYFLGRDVHSRFDTLVFSIVSDPAGLFNYDTGILVPGRIRSDFIRANPGRNIIPPDPANFNMRGEYWERPISFEAFENGERVLVQDAGMRVHGGWSRGVEQKSLRIIARREYSPEAGRFHFPFFPGDYALDGFNTPITRYDTLILRNGGNDRYHGMLRNEVGSVIARRAGFHTVTPVRPAAVFLNGEYYGFVWVQVRMNDQYLEDLHGAPDREFDNIGGAERAFDTDDRAVLADLYAKREFETRDLRDDRIFAEFKAIVDVENLLWYYAFQIFMGNHDWPHNNLRRWRYIGEQIPGLPPELDGRWRYTMFDLDWILGLYGDNYRKPTFRNVVQGTDYRHSPILVNLLTRYDMSDMFAMMLNDIAANVVTADIVQATIDELLAAAGNEMRHSIAAGKYPNWFTWGFAEENHRGMVEFARNRHRYIFQNVSTYLGFPNRLFNVRVTGGEAIIGTVRGTSSRYFEHLTVPVSPVLPEFTAFSHWEIGARRVYTPDVTVSLSDAVNGTVTMRLVTRPDYPPLIIAAAHGNRDGNGILLRNPTNRDVYATGLFISNRAHELQRWRLPELNVPANGYVELAGRSSRDNDDLHRIPLNFNVRTGRMLFLSDESGRVLQTFIPE